MHHRASRGKTDTDRQTDTVPAPSNGMHYTVSVTVQMELPQPCPRVPVSVCSNKICLSMDMCVWCVVSFFFLFYLFGTLIKFVACQGATVVQRRHFQPRSEDFTRFLVACLDYPLDAVPGSISASNGQ